jgi:hypothetical protein
LILVIVAVKMTIPRDFTDPDAASDEVDDFVLTIVGHGATVTDGG